MEDVSQYAKRRVRDVATWVGIIDAMLALIAVILQSSEPITHMDVDRIVATIGKEDPYLWQILNDPLITIHRAQIDPSERLDSWRASMALLKCMLTETPDSVSFDARIVMFRAAAKNTLKQARDQRR